MYRDDESLSQCLLTGLFAATGFTVLALVSVSVGAIVISLGRGIGWIGQGLSQLPVAAIAVVSSYYVAGLVGAVAYYLLQSFSHRYLGQVLLAFVLGGIVYGTVGLSGTLAYVYFGLNMFSVHSAAEAWHLLPRVTLLAAAGTAILGPPLWRSRSF